MKIKSILCLFLLFAVHLIAGINPEAIANSRTGAEIPSCGQTAQKGSTCCRTFKEIVCTECRCCFTSTSDVNYEPAEQVLTHNFQLKLPVDLAPKIASIEFQPVFQSLRACVPGSQRVEILSFLPDVGRAPPVA